MLIPAEFQETKTEEMHRIIRNFPLGTLVTHTEHGLDGNHIPFELQMGKEPADFLNAHIARDNPLTQQIQADAEVLVIFRGVQGYISPSWFPNKQITHRFVPTWNYEVVHVHGRMQLIDDDRFKRGLLAKLTRAHEANQSKPWKMGDAPADFLDQMLRAIVGVTVQITRMECVRKLSQNREQVDFEGALQGLRHSGQSDLANAMESLRKGETSDAGA
jgi:transcriptional regulator